MILGCRNDFEHGLVGLRSVFEQRHAVAKNERIVVNVLLQRNLPIQDVDVTGLLFQRIDDGCATLGRHRSEGVIDARSLERIASAQLVGVGQCGAIGHHRANEHEAYGDKTS